MNHPLKIHQDSGRYVLAGNTKAFVIDKGKGEPVVCLHGVPASSFLYRKIIGHLAANGARGISFDLLGMGLSDKPLNSDYSWTGLGEWSLQVIQALELDKMHLVLHDIGGPIGCELIAKIPERIMSVTILNAPLANLGTFTKPFPMYFFERKIVGEVFLSTTNYFLFKKLMHLRGIHRNQSFGNAEARAYVQLLKGTDGGRAFLSIMRSFEATATKEAFYLRTLQALPARKRIVWGINDKGLTLDKYGLPLKEELGLEEIIEVPGSHFLQEDYPDMVTKHILSLVKQP